MTEILLNYKNKKFKILIKFYLIYTYLMVQQILKTIILHKLLFMF